MMTSFSSAPAHVWPGVTISQSWRLWRSARRELIVGSEMGVARARGRRVRMAAMLMERILQSSICK